LYLENVVLTEIRTQVESGFEGGCVLRELALSEICT
jgi:hypothetical protein